MATTNATTGGTLATRPSASRKLLTMKAGQAAAAATRLEGDALEDSFPSADHTGQASATPEAAAADVATPNTPPTHGSAELPAPLAPAASTWTEDDERALQTMAARRKAAGYQRRGRDVGGQVLRAGGIAPNPGTVAAAIMVLVAERGTVSREDLVAAMAAATFPHARARPADKGWCQGYIAGCVRDGFLALVAAGDSASDQPADAGGER